MSEQHRYPNREQLGATGKFPYGKIHPSDEGELRCAVGFDPSQKAIILDFGKPITWLALHKEEAQAFVNLISHKIDQMD